MDTYTIKTLYPVKESGDLSYILTEIKRLNREILNHQQLCLLF